MFRILRRKWLRDLLLTAALLLATVGLVAAPGEAIAGAKDGLALCGNVIIPSLFPFFVLASLVVDLGLAAYLGRALEPVLTAVGIPVETIGLLLVRPVSGSAALGVGAELISTYGPDSLVGRTAAVMLGSTETTFYTIAVYFGAAKVAKTRYAVPAALCGDVAGFLAASWAVRLVFYS